MATFLTQHLIDHPTDRPAVEVLEKEMRARVRGYRLRELRETYGLTQREAARLLQMSPQTIGRIEHGDVDRMRIETLRRYVEFLGGTLRIEIEIGDSKSRIA